MPALLSLAPRTCRASLPWSLSPETGATRARPCRQRSPSPERNAPLLPRKQCTLHGVQGKTADPGFIAHWAFPVGLSDESRWLAYYVSLSRPRGFSRLLSHGLPDRDIIEGGPPENITNAFEELFSQKIAATKRACARARTEMGWPARRG